MPTESQLWLWMREGQYPPLIEQMGAYVAHLAGVYGLNRRAHATLSRDVGELKAGTRVNVVMASGLGDVGITTDLKAHHGYSHRIVCVESTNIVNQELNKPQGILIDIEPIEDTKDRVKAAFPCGAKNITEFDEYV